MVFSTLRLTVFASLLATAGCSSIDNEIPKISGYVMPTAALSEGQPVRILVTLADVSKQDVAAVALSQASFALTPQWPVRYALPYDPGQVGTIGTFAVQVRVTDAQENLIAITDTRHEFSPKSDPDNFDLLVRNLANPGNQSGAFEIECKRKDYLATFYDGFLELNDFRGDSRRILIQTEAASGGKYSRGAEFMWFKGDEASHMDGTEMIPCEMSKVES